MDKLKTISLQTTWQLLNKAITSISTFIILAFVTRTYGAEGTGVFTLALTFLAFFYLLVDFGLNAYCLPHLLKENFQEQFSKLLGIRLLLASILVLLALALVLLWPNTQLLFKLSVSAGVLAIYGSAVYITANAYFQSRQRYDLSLAASSLGAVITLLLVYLFSQFSLPLPYLSLAHMLGWLGCGIFALYQLSSVVNIRPKLDWSYFKTTISNVWPLALTLGLNVVYFRLDSFILSFTQGFTIVGIYNLAYQLFQFVLVIPTYITNSLFPWMIKDYAKDPQQYFKYLIRDSSLLFVLGILATIFTWILAEPVIRLVSGDQNFVGSAEALRVLSLSFPAFFATSTLMLNLINTKRLKTLAFIYLSGLVINAVLNLLLIPRYSYLAASWVTVGGEYLILIVQLVILAKLRNEN